VIQLEDNPAVAKRNAEISFILFVLGGIIGLLNLHLVVPFGEGFEMYGTAANLANHGAYANPFHALPTDPSAVCPPLYPFLLALLMKVLRLPALVLLAASLGNIFVNALTAAWLPRVSWLFYGDAGPGIAASVLWLMAAQLMPSWDASYTVAALIFFCLFSAATFRKERVFVFGVSAGLLAGALLLLNPISLLVFAPWIGYLLVFQRTTLKHAAAYCCIVLGTAALVVFPWALRNDRQLGGFVIRTGLGLNLYIKNNDCSKISLYEDLHNGCSLTYEPTFNVNEARAVRDLGEINYDRLRMADAKAWIRTHPKAFLRLTLVRARAFWFPPLEEYPFRATVISIATMLSIPGLVLMAYRRERITVFVLVVLLIFPPMYYIISSNIRSRYPILWLSLLPAGYFVLWLARLGKARLQLKPIKH
jgi:hypothetical protein